MMLRFVLAWLPVLALLLALGVLRERARGPEPPPPSAVRKGGLVAAVALGGYIALLLRALPPPSADEALAMGASCLVLTAVTRLLVGYVIGGYSWQRFRAEFDPTRGGPWLLVLVWIGLAPYLFYRLG